MDMDAISSQLLYRYSSDHSQERSGDTSRRQEPVDGHHPGRRIGHAHRHEHARSVEQRREVDERHEKRGHHHEDDEAGALRYRRSERTALHFQTQEGDTVRLKIKASESLRISTGESDDDGRSIADLELQARSRTRISFKVKGELNEAELAAIQSVIGQAGAMAEDFFTGDAAAAFSAASSLEIDAAQLANVSIRMKRSEQLTYPMSGMLPAQTGQPQAVERQPVAGEPSAGANEAGADVDTPAAPVDKNAAATDTAAGNDSATAPVAEEPATEVAAEDAGPVSFMANTLQSIGVFLNNLLDNFGSNEEAADDQAAPVDMTLKLQVFRSMLLSVSELQNPAEQDPATALAAETIDAVSTQQTPLDAVA